MPITHTNRKGDTYTLYEGRTKTGKPKYYMARKASTSGHPVDTIPDGYEIRESPADATVSVRKVKPCRITEEECRLVRQAVEKNEDVASFLLDADGDAITVYVSDKLALPTKITSIYGVPIAPRRIHYSPEMRFVLIDEEERLFAGERWCYRGSIDDWFPVGQSGPLANVVEACVPHLGRESFYELF